ncbi:hypothetical protein [Stieleria bergensis]
MGDIGLEPPLQQELAILDQSQRLNVTDMLLIGYRLIHWLLASRSADP